MADRVFPNNTNIDMGSKIQFSGIDWGQVENNMKSTKVASDQNKVNLLLEMLAEEQGVPFEEVEEAFEKVVGDDMDEDADEDMDEDVEVKDMNMEFDPGMDVEVHDMEDHEEMEEPGPVEKFTAEKFSKTNNTMKKIAFTHPSQISAEAIEKARAAGDTAMVNTILAARKANRVRIAQKIEEKYKNEQELEKRAAARQTLIKMAQMGDSTSNPYMEMDTDVLSNLAKTYKDKPVDPMLEQALKAKGAPTLAFTEPTKFSKAQRESFNRIAMSLGMPKEYVEAMTTPAVSESTVKLADDVKAIYSSSASDNSKKTAVASLIKEAKLSEESKDEFINYWNNVLGYQDKDFWPMVAADYEDGKKVK